MSNSEEEPALVQKVREYVRNRRKVEAALELDPTNLELIELEADLNELIVLTRRKLAAEIGNASPKKEDCDEKTEDAVVADNSELAISGPTPATATASTMASTTVSPVPVPPRTTTIAAPATWSPIPPAPAPTFSPASAVTLPKLGQTSNYQNCNAFAISSTVSPINVCHLPPPPAAPPTIPVLGPSRSEANANERVILDDVPDSDLLDDSSWLLIRKSDRYKYILNRLRRRRSQLRAKLFRGHDPAFVKSDFQMK